MKKLLAKLALTVLLLAYAGGAVFSATPAKPYADLTSGDVLTATWLMGYFNTLYAWAQATNASVTLLIGGVSTGAPSTASLTTTIASPSQTLLFDTTGLGYTSLTSSGTMAVDATVIAVATGTAHSARFEVKGAVQSASGTNALLEGVILMSWRSASATAEDWSVTLTSPAAGRVAVVASSPAGVVWKAKVTTMENGF